MNYSRAAFLPLLIFFIFSSLIGYDLLGSDQPVLWRPSPVKSKIGFSNTLALLHFRKFYPERKVLIEKYRPYFGHMLYSIPRVHFNESLSHQNMYCGDEFVVNDCFYKAIQIASERKLGGILWFHFDFWLVPQQITDLSFDVPWQLRSNNPNSVNPPVRSINVWNEEESTQLMNEWGWFQTSDIAKYHRLFERLHFLFEPEKNFTLQTGWSDLVYFPSIVFDKVTLILKEMNEVELFHEMQYPTMLGILSQLGFPYETLTCQGNCCDPVTAEDIRSSVCGHKLDLQNPEHRQVHFDRVGKAVKF